MTTAARTSRGSLQTRPNLTRRLQGHVGTIPYDVQVTDLPSDRFDLGNFGSAPNRGYRVGVDLGGSKAHAVLTSNEQSGAVLGETVSTHPVVDGKKVRLTPEGVAKTIAANVASLLAEKGLQLEDLDHVGTAVPGPLNSRGAIIKLPNIPGFEGVDLGKLVSQELGGVRVSIGNDLDAAAMHARGSLPDSRNTAVIYVGTGIGAGFVLGSVPLLGAGELGHTRVGLSRREQSQPSPRYAQLNPGHDPHAVEAYLSGPSLADRYQRELGDGLDDNRSSVRDWVEGDLHQINASHIDQAAGSGDPYAAGFIADAANMLATLIGAHVLPYVYDSVVLGGGALKHSPNFVGLALSLAAERLPKELIDVPTFYVPQDSGTNAAQGAAYLG